MRVIGISPNVSRPSANVYSPPNWLQPPLPVAFVASNASVGSLPETVVRPATETAFQDVPARVGMPAGPDGLAAPPAHATRTHARSATSAVFMTARRPFSPPGSAVRPTR